MSGLLPVSVAQSGQLDGLRHALQSPLRHLPATECDGQLSCDRVGDLGLFAGKTTTQIQQAFERDNLALPCAALHRTTDCSAGVSHWVVSGVIRRVAAAPYLYRFGTKIRFWGWLIAVIAGLVLASAMLNNVNPDGDSLAARKANLDSAREYTFPQTLDMLIEKPFTGYGYGNFESAYTLYTARQHLLNHNYPLAYQPWITRTMSCFIGASRGNHPADWDFVGGLISA